MRYLIALVLITLSSLTFISLSTSVGATPTVSGEATITPQSHSKKDALLAKFAKMKAKVQTVLDKTKASIADIDVQIKDLEGKLANAKSRTESSLLLKKENLLKSQKAKYEKLIVKLMKDMTKIDLSVAKANMY